MSYVLLAAEETPDLYLPGVYTIAGAEATLFAPQIGFAVDPGAYATTGSEVFLVVGLAGDPGSFALSGAETTAALDTPVDPGMLSLTGAGAMGATGTPASPGAYAVTGVQAEVGGNEEIPADPGAYQITGTIAHLAGISPAAVRLPYRFPDPVTGEWDAYAVQENFKEIVALLRDLLRRVSALESR